MKQLVIKLLLFLLFGAIINVAVAWGCVTMIHPQSGQSTLSEQNIDGHQQIVCTTRGFGRTRVSHYPGGISENVSAIFSKFIVEWDLPGGADDFAGWPWLCMTCSNDSATVFLNDGDEWTSYSGDSTQQLIGGIELKPFPTSGAGPVWKALPITILWPAFLGNSLFYAAIFGALCAGLYQTRKLLRKMKGVCSSCAYPIGTSNTCTECGSQINSP